MRAAVHALFLLRVCVAHGFKDVACQALELEVAALRKENERLRKHLARHLDALPETCSCSPTTTDTALTYPYWHLTSGDCELEGDCLTSPGFSDTYYPDDAECTITILENWTGYLEVVAFDLEDGYDYLEVNGLIYTGDESPSGLTGVQPTGMILFSSDHSYTAPGFKLCRTNVTVTTTTTTTQPINQNGTYWQVADGPCSLDEDECIQTPNYGTDDYPDDQSCTIRLTEFWDGASLHVVDFNTERRYDVMYVNGIGFSGDDDDDESLGLQGLVPTRDIVWTSDDSRGDPGWRICRMARDELSWEPWSNWTCTVDGYPCSASSLCTRQFSDPDDDDDDGSVHDGHPWCMAHDPSELNASNAATPCGPCSCSSGEEQTYSSSWFTDDWFALTYISCHPCQPGNFKPEGRFGAQLWCSLCPVGRFTTYHGATACDTCEIGRTSSEGSTACEPCAPGTFSEMSGTTECTHCAVGTYSDVAGSSVCHSCHDELNPGGPNADLWVTMEKVVVNSVLSWSYLTSAKSKGSCGCDIGSWMSPSSECSVCGEGMICTGMGTVYLEAGYFAPVDDASNVWTCHGVEGRCPGGVPGTCAEHRLNTSIACGECIPGTRPTTSGACVDCLATDLLLLVGAFVLGFLGLLAAYRVLDSENRARQTASVVLMTIVTSQILTAWQMLGVFDLISVTWPEPFATVVALGSIQSLDINLLHVTCVTSASALVTYCGKLFGFVLVLVVLFGTHTLHVLFYHGGRFRKRHTSFLCCVGTVIMAVFISLSAAIFAPVQCEEHPNGYQTVKSYSQVLCWTRDFGNGDQHRQMIIIGAIASVIPLSFVTLCVWVVVQLPARVRSGDTAFLNTYAFLIFRFRPETCWFVVVLLVRNLAVALVPIATSATLQLCSLAVALGMGIVSCALKLPWRVPAANVLDLCTNSGFLVVAFLGALATDGEDENVISNMLIATSIAVLVILICPLVKIGYALLLVRSKAFEFFLCHHKQGGGGFTRLLKMRLKVDQRVTGEVFLDADDLQDLNVLFSVVSNDTRTLVVVGTAEILSRPWCVGEMTTARVRSIDTVLVLLPDFSWPSLDFVNNYSTHVEGVLSLARFGVSVPMVKDTLRWLPSCPRVQLPQNLTLAVVDAVAGKLVSRQRGRLEMSPQRGIESHRVSRARKSSPTCSLAEDVGDIPHVVHRVQDLADPVADTRCQIAVIVHSKNWDAVCAAHMVQKMLIPYLPPTLEWMVHVVSDDEALPHDLSILVVICTNGCFFSAPFARKLLQAEGAGAHLIPVVAEPQFRFPSDACIDDIRSTPGVFPQATQHDAECLGRTVRAMFSEIAVSVDLQDSLEVLDVRVRALARRLTAHGSCTEALDELKLVPNPPREVTADRAYKASRSDSGFSSRRSSASTDHVSVDHVSVWI